MPKTPGCSSEQIGVVRPALLRSADIEHFCDLTTILVFNRRSNDLVGNMQNFS
jgi:hypothetical protein